MVYGIISQLDDVTTRELFRNKRITEENIVHINLISHLVNVVKSGDVGLPPVHGKFRRHVFRFFFGGSGERSVMLFAVWIRVGVGTASIGAGW